MINFYKTQDEAKKEKNTRKLPARHLSGRMKSKCKHRDVEDEYVAHYQTSLCLMTTSKQG